MKALDGAHRSASMYVFITRPGGMIEKYGKCVSLKMCYSKRHAAIDPPQKAPSCLTVFRSSSEGPLGASPHQVWSKTQCTLPPSLLHVGVLPPQPLHVAPSYVGCEVSTCMWQVGVCRPILSSILLTIFVIQHWGREDAEFMNCYQ